MHTRACVHANSGIACLGKCFLCIKWSLNVCFVQGPVRGSTFCSCKNISREGLARSGATCTIIYPGEVPLHCLLHVPLRLETRASPSHPCLTFDWKASHLDVPAARYGLRPRVLIQTSRVRCFWPLAWEGKFKGQWIRIHRQLLSCKSRQGHCLVRIYCGPRPPEPPGKALGVLHTRTNGSRS